ncbi:hypothetical protein LCGC14_0659890 [marine sediment metagenome]|uniref:Uncharacterized protein n=1 Tax=marine sediment metagenome TaxID=412755 RepID=A0A0F9QTX3_9ZZZZ
METNMNAEIHEELKNKGQILIDAAYEFWKIHQKLCGPRAVVWLEASDGHFVLFTRSEYRQQIMSKVECFSEETPLEEPFVMQEKIKLIS